MCPQGNVENIFYPKQERILEDILEEEKGALSLFDSPSGGFGYQAALINNFSSKRPLEPHT